MNRRIAAELTKILDFYPNAKISEADKRARVESYAEYLEDLPEDLVVQAIRECAKTSTFYPSLAEIRNRVITIAGEGVLVAPETAWGEVMKEVRRIGYQRYANGEELRFSSPMIAKAVESIGWRDICMCEIDNLNTLRAQFRNALTAIQHCEVDRVVSGRNPSVAAISEGVQPAKRNGLAPIGDLVVLKDWEDRG